MNYRHAYHAGNFADVLKHAVLTRVIEYMKRKEAPFRVIDTHAGAGRYDLASTEAGKTGEWRDGIGRLLSAGAASLPQNVADLLAPYLGAVSDENGGGPLVRYPGSPRLALRLLREQDRLVANELHPEDGAKLKAALAKDRRARVMELDAWVALRALLPPKERRGIVLIDPPFEEPGEFERITSGLADGLARFAAGTYIAWYPIKDPKPIARWRRSLSALPAEKVLVVELMIFKPDNTERFNGCGMIIINAPFTLHDELAILLPELTRRLAQGQHASYRLEQVRS